MLYYTFFLLCESMSLTYLLNFQIFGGVGIACLPLGLIFSFIRRPKAVITRSQYIKVLWLHLVQPREFISDGLYFYIKVAYSYSLLTFRKQPN